MIPLTISRDSRFQGFKRQNFMIPTNFTAMIHDSWFRFHPRELAVFWAGYFGVSLLSRARWSSLLSKSTSKIVILLLLSESKTKIRFKVLETWDTILC